MAYSAIWGRHSFSLFSIKGLFEKSHQLGHSLNGKVRGNGVVALRDRFRFTRNRLHVEIRLPPAPDKRVTQRNYSRSTNVLNHNECRGAMSLLKFARPLYKAREDLSQSLASLLVSQLQAFIELVFGIGDQQQGAY